MSAFPKLAPGALILSGVAQKQPHGVFSSLRGKQTRWFELKMSKETLPELVYYEHPKTSSSQAKGIVHLDSRSVKIARMGKEIRITGASHNTGGGRGAAGERNEAHVIGDMLMEFQSLEVCEKWESALNYSMSQLDPRPKQDDSYKNYGDKSPRRGQPAAGAASKGVPPAAATVKAAPAPDSHPESTRYIHDLIRLSGLKARDDHPESTRFVYDLIKKSTLKAVDKHPDATRAIVNLILHPK